MKVIDTEDGSKTIKIEEMNETYHSIHGALQESLHVYIKNGYRHCISKKPSAPINILEVGLGTGLNVILTCLESEKFKYPTNFISLEPNPIPAQILFELKYGDLFSNPKVEEVIKQIHSEIWNSDVFLNNFLIFKKVQNRIQDFDFKHKNIDLIYYDAFAPGKQPEMWNFDIFQKIFEALNPGGILVTYCAQGQFKRDLKNIGFEIESLIGPPGKKEMIRVTKP